MINSYIRTTPETRDITRCVGYGIAYSDGTLAIPCTGCKAPVGVQCTKRGGGSHARRGDKARQYFLGRAMRLFEKLEAEALAVDPTGPLWTFQSLPHQCGTLGGHVLTECKPAVA